MGLVAGDLAGECVRNRTDDADAQAVAASRLLRCSGVTRMPDPPRFLPQFHNRYQRVIDLERKFLHRDGTQTKAWHAAHLGTRGWLGAARSLPWDSAGGGGRR